MITSF